MNTLIHNFDFQRSDKYLWWIDVRYRDMPRCCLPWCAYRNWPRC